MLNAVNINVKLLNDILLWLLSIEYLPDDEYFLDNSAVVGA